jgi:HlyD family secretion protein
MRNVGTARFWVSTGALVAGLAALGAAGYQAVEMPPAHSETTHDPNPLEALWAAAAPGRVEPKGGELRVAAPVPGVIKDVLIGLNDKVKAGDLLIQLDDGELQAKLAAARSIAALRLTERDAVEARGAALDRRKAEDALFEAERAAFSARLDLDRLISELRANKVSLEDVDNGRKTVLAAESKLDTERAALGRFKGEKLPALTKEEAALAAARADVSAVSVNLERMRIRAPGNATILELNAKVGETAGAGAPLAVLGDTTHLQVRAEVEERDVPKIFVGQPSVVRSDAFPGRSFEARVALMAKALGAPKLTARGGRKQTDVEVLEVVLDLEDGVPLLPGMRMDVLFKAADAAAKSSGIKTQ